VSDELAKFAQVFCLVVIVATPLLLLYSRRRGKGDPEGAPAWIAGADATSPQHGHSCDHGAPDGGRAGSDCGGSH
jgi:hypothetical protein